MSRPMIARGHLESPGLAAGDQLAECGRDRRRGCVHGTKR